MDSRAKENYPQLPRGPVIACHSLMGRGLHRPLGVGYVRFARSLALSEHIQELAEAVIKCTRTRNEAERVIRGDRRMKGKRASSRSVLFLEASKVFSHRIRYLYRRGVEQSDRDEPTARPSRSERDVRWSQRLVFMRLVSLAQHLPRGGRVICVAYLQPTVLEGIEGSRSGRHVEPGFKESCRNRKQIAVDKRQELVIPESSSGKFWKQ